MGNEHIDILPEGPNTKAIVIFGKIEHEFYGRNTQIIRVIFFHAARYVYHDPHIWLGIGRKQ